MGNACFGKSTHNKGVVHPIAVHRDQGVTIKVRMTKRQLKGLIEKVDMSNDMEDDTELGRLIVQECSKGKLRARVVTAAKGENDHSYKFSRGQQGLRPIQEDFVKKNIMIHDV
ncbi:unnamed protein product [Vicia faba]|uniref:Uncharacterized protein n=1 Tax=Vicia faba TaxID=3906 RepID=A0AAV1AZ26_VICFA|nr:unnamed protein product [Vicia faba]